MNTQPVTPAAENLLNTTGRAAVRRVSEPIIELKDVQVYHRARTGGIFKPNIVKAVDGVNLAIRRGETIGLVGESGCGKSTLASVIVGLQKPTGGDVLFKGKSALKRNAALRKEFGSDVSIVFQDPSTALNPRMTVQDILKDPLDVHGIGDKAGRDRRVRELLHLVGLPASAADALPSQISGGQRQRVAIARALVNNPHIIMADEPTGNLDTKSTKDIMRLFEALHEEHKTIILVTHEPEIAACANRQLLLSDGRITKDAGKGVVMDVI